MLFSLMDRAVKSFSIAKLIIFSLFARLLALLLHPPVPSILAPDEGAYASLASWVADSRNTSDFPTYGAGLYNTSKTLVLPAAAMVKIGIDELTAVRIISIIYGLLGRKRLQKQMPFAFSRQRKALG